VRPKETLTFCNRVFSRVGGTPHASHVCYLWRDLGLLVVSDKGQVRASLRQRDAARGTLFEVWGSGKTRPLALRSLRNRLKALGRIGGLV
jgi:hypothetical protein